MNKSLYTKTIKGIAKWTGVDGQDVDTSTFRYPKNLQHTFATKDWALIVDYNQSDDDNKIRPVSDRSISFYYTDKSRGYTVSKSIFIFGTDDGAYKSLYSNNANVNTKENGDHVASYRKDIDLLYNDGTYASNFDNVICHLIFSP